MSRQDGDVVQCINSEPHKAHEYASNEGAWIRCNGRSEQAETSVPFDKGMLNFALSWALAAMNDDFMDLQAEDYKDPAAVEDAEFAREILKALYEALGGESGD